MQIKTKIVSSLTANSKPVKQEVNSTVILPPLVFPALPYDEYCNLVIKLSVILLIVIMISVIIHCAEHCYGECHYAVFPHAECHYAISLYAECHYA